MVFYPCQGEGNDLIVYDPQGYESKDGLRAGCAAPHDLREIVRFTLPRQREGRRLSITDYFLPRAAGESMSSAWSTGDRAYDPSIHPNEKRSEAFGCQHEELILDRSTGVRWALGATQGGRPRGSNRCGHAARDITYIAPVAAVAPSAERESRGRCADEEPSAEGPEVAASRPP